MCHVNGLLQRTKRENHTIRWCNSTKHTDTHSRNTDRQSDTHTDTHMSTHQTIERNCVSQKSKTKSKGGEQVVHEWVEGGKLKTKTVSILFSAYQGATLAHTHAGRECAPLRAHQSVTTLLFMWDNVEREGVGRESVQRSYWKREFKKEFNLITLAHPVNEKTTQFSLSKWIKSIRNVHRT